MIAYRHDNILENSKGKLELPLMNAANQLLDLFLPLVHALADGTPPSRLHRSLDRFMLLLVAYYTCFRDWKLQDEAKLLARIKNALLTLYDAEQHLPPDESEGSERKIQLRQQIEKLRSKLKQIGGVDALDHFDQCRRSPLPVETTATEGLFPLRKELLIHELLINPGFTLEDTHPLLQRHHPFTSLQQATSFWESLVTDVSHLTPCFARVAQVLDLIFSDVAELQRFLPPHPRVISWDTCGPIISTLFNTIRAHAPPQHLHLQQLQQPVDSPRALCNALRLLKDFAQAVLFHHYNLKLQDLSRLVQDHGIDFERIAFTRKFGPCPLLPHTRKWHAAAAAQSTQKRDFIRFHTTAVLHLIATNDFNTEDHCPEVLLLDAHHLADISHQVHHLVASATILALPSSSHALTQAVVESEEGIDHLLQAVTAAAPALASPIQHCVQRTDPIYKLM